MLFVPGDRPERFDKAAASGADAVILDLEDAVTADRRGTARVEVARYLGAAARSVPLWVRINPADSPDALADLTAVIAARPDGILLPKPASVDDLWRVDHWLEALEAAQGFAPGAVALLPIVTEKARAVLGLATWGRLPARVAGLTWGAEDLAADIGAQANRTTDGAYEPPFLLARSLCLLAAGAAGVPAYDTIDIDFRDLAAIERRSREAKRLGFSGQIAIHPAQIAAIHAAYTPSAEEIRWAERVLEAFRAAPGRGAVSLDGRMLDQPHLRQAEQILAAQGFAPGAVALLPIVTEKARA
ncbi:MAG TPA: CoA ester lyase, partial [Steroidobacteraceae bacterium]